MAEPGREVNTLVDHLFRHEAGKMVSVLTRLFGLKNMELAEDIVHESMYQALVQWPYAGIPDNPSAWLYKVARYKTIDFLRRESKNISTDTSLMLELSADPAMGNESLKTLFLEHEIQDSQLRMIFSCCHPEVPPEAQIALILKTLCGFSAKEIASAFLSQEDTVNKRLTRARQKIRSLDIELQVPSGHELKQRLDAALKAIYLLFNEGYNSSNPEKLIRKELCLEAMRLTILLSEQQITNTPKTQSLLALMCFLAARLDSRLDTKGEIILLEDQDRNRWDKGLIGRGMYYLEIVSESRDINEYFLEASIQALHCSAPSFKETRWDYILNLYNQLILIKDSSIIRLHRAIALGQAQGPETAIAILLKIEGLHRYYLYYASLGRFYQLSGQHDEAMLNLEKALDLATSSPEKQLLQKRLTQCRLELSKN